MNDNITFPDIPTITATATHMISIPTPTEIKMIFLFMMEVCSLCFPIRTDNKMTCGGFMIEVLSSCKGRFIIVHFYSPKTLQSRIEKIKEWPTKKKSLVISFSRECPRFERVVEFWLNRSPAIGGPHWGSMYEQSPRNYWAENELPVEGTSRQDNLNESNLI